MGKIFDRYAYLPCSAVLISFTEVVRPVVALKSVSCKLFLRVDCCHSSNKSEWKISGQTYLGAWEKFILGMIDILISCLLTSI